MEEILTYVFENFQVPLVASNRIGKEIIQTEHGKSEITFYGNSFIAGGQVVNISLISLSLFVCLPVLSLLMDLEFEH